jgi:hypothetical protein
MRLNSADSYEPITIILTKENTPIAYNNKIEELVEQGIYSSKEEAEKNHSSIAIECEIYYDKHNGLFAVESDAVESNCDIYSPYSAELCEPYKEDIYVYNIIWETDDADDVDLPNSVHIPSIIDEDMITDWLSDQYGFLIKSYELSRL